MMSEQKPTVYSSMKTKGKRGAAPKRQAETMSMQWQTTATPSVSKTDRRPILYPVKKKMIHHEQKCDPYPQDSCEMTDPSMCAEATSCNDYLQSARRFHVVYSSTPLTLTRPYGVRFNLQAPGGGRARFPLLSDGSQNPPTTSYTCLSDPSSAQEPGHVSGSTSADDYPISCSNPPIYPTSCSNPVFFNHPACYIMQPVQSNMSGMPVSEEISAWSLPAPIESETPWVPSFQEPFASYNDVKNEDFHEQYFCQSFRDEKPEDILLSPPFSGEQSPASHFTGNASFLAPAPQAHYPANITPPAEDCLIQENEIDYSLFDEFFVRT